MTALARRRWVRRILIAMTAVVLVSGLAAVGTVVWVFWYYGRGVSELDEERLKDYRPPQVTRIYSRDHELIGEIYSQRRTFIDFEHIPSHVENAFLAAEDADFYRHQGMDYMGMVRALIANVRAGEIKQGASTITQQVVKVFMLDPSRTFERKVQELILARRLEQAFTKQEILELYLNEIYLGHGRYGIEEASRFYFGKSAREIDLGQAALLATLPKAPGRDSPLRNPEKSKARQRYVLGQMVKHGFATAEEADRYADADLDLADAPSRPSIQAGAEEFVDAVKGQLRERYGEELDVLGAEVTTTVSLALQRKTREAAVAGLQLVDARKKYARELKPAKDKEREQALERGRAPLSVGAQRPALTIATPADVKLPGDGIVVRIGDAHAFIPVPAGSRYDAPEITLEEQFIPGAIVPVRITRGPAKPGESLPEGWVEAELAAGPESAVLIADVQTGELLAMIGGSSYGRAQFNRATQAQRQPGSTFKPFVYGAALQSKRYTAASLIADSPEIYEKWKPTNYIRDKYLGDIRMRVALTKSVNTVAIKLADQVGIDKVHEFAAAAGIESELPDNLSLALGTGEVTPLEMTRAYLTLARGGSRIEPRMLREVSRAQRRVDPEPRGPSKCCPKTWCLS